MGSSAIAYTPTVTQAGATITVPSAFYMRVGNVGFLWGNYNVTVGAAATVTISLPAGWTASIALVVAVGQVAPLVAAGAVLETATATTIATGAAVTSSTGTWVFGATVPLLA